MGQYFKKRASRYSIFSILFITLTVVNFQACNQMQFSADSGFSSSGNCADVLRQTTTDLRIVFLVDNSGSTGDTDPKHSYRVMTLNKFLDDYGSKSNFSYGFGYFSGSAQFFNMDSMSFSKNLGRSVDVNGLRKALDLYDDKDTGGGTSYGSAFDKLRDALTRDQANGGHSYSIVFMSDGMPTDLGDSSQIPTQIQLLVGDLRNSVGAKGGALSLSAVYFGPPSSVDAISNLQGMAAAGRGQFVDTNHLPNGLVIGDVISVPGECE